MHEHSLRCCVGGDFPTPDDPDQNPDDLNDIENDNPRDLDPEWNSGSGTYHIRGNSIDFTPRDLEDIKTNQQSLISRIVHAVISRRRNS